MARKVLANLDDLPDPGHKAVKVSETLTLLLIRRGKEVVAFDNSCPHEGGPLDEGEFSDGKVSCPWHGWQFSTETGACLTVPTEDLVPYNVIVEGGVIFLED